MLIDFHILPPTTRNQAGGVVAVVTVPPAKIIRDADFSCYRDEYFCGESWQSVQSSLGFKCPEQGREWLDGYLESTFRTDVSILL